MKCNTCLNTRVVLSENGFHYICCLSSRKANKCIIDGRYYIARKPKFITIECPNCRCKIHVDRTEATDEKEKSP